MKKFDITFDKGACTCNICHRHYVRKAGKLYPQRIVKIKYYTQNYASNKIRGKICQNLQKHPHEIWICEKCLDDLRSEWWSKTNEQNKIWGFEKDEPIEMVII